MSTSGQVYFSSFWLLVTFAFASNSSPVMAEGTHLDSSRSSEPNSMDSSSWSVMNVKLGDAADEAESKINSDLNKLFAKTESDVSKLAQVTRKQTIGRFTSPPIRLGSTFNGSYGPEHRSGISISMSYQFPSGKVFAIRRTAYSLDPAPTLQAVQESLRKKFGNPQGINMNRAETIVYTWVVGNRIPLQKNSPAVIDDDSGGYAGAIQEPYDIRNFKGGTHLKCSNSILSALKWNRGINRGLNQPSNKNCGTFFQVRLSITAEKVRAIDTFLVDNAAWDQTNLSFGNYMNSHAAATENASNKQHRTPKAPYIK